VRPELFPALDAANGVPPPAGVRAVSSFAMQKTAGRRRPGKLFSGVAEPVREPSGDGPPMRRRSHAPTAPMCRAAFLKRFFAQRVFDARAGWNSYATLEGMPTAATADRDLKLILQSC
jgi:hypothetical protein